MARINIEDDLFKDDRFTDLCIRLGSRTMALGALVEAFILAQKHYLSTVNDRLIPFNEWDRNRAVMALEAAGLAERREKGIYVCGADEQFKWLMQRSEAGKQLKGKGRKRPLTGRNGSKRVETSSSSSSSGSNSDSDLNTGQRASSPPQDVVGQQTKFPMVVSVEVLGGIVKHIIAWYCDCWKIRYGTNPPINGKVAGQIKQLVKDLGGARAKILIKSYLDMPDTWFVTKRHDIATMLGNLNAVAQFADTGKMVTSGHLKKLDEQVDLAMGPKPKGIAEILADKQKQLPKGEQ